MIMPLFKKKSPEESIPDSYEYACEHVIIITDKPCVKKPKKNRAEIIKKMEVGDFVNLELAKRGNQLFHLVVDPKSKLDIGELSYGVSDFLLEKYQNANFIAFISEPFRNSYRVKIYAENKKA